MRTSLLAFALALSSMGSAALADGRVTLAYTGFEKDDTTTQGMTYTFEGKAYGFGYEGYVFDGDVEDVDAKTAGLKLDWTGVGFHGVGIGPALAYNMTSLGGTRADGFSGGLAAKAAFGRSTVDIDALVSFDDKEYWTIALDGETPLSPRTTLLTDYAFAKMDSEESHTFGLGVRHDINPMAYVEGKAFAERSYDSTGTGALVGLGFRF